MLNGTGYEGTRASGSCTTITNSFKVMTLKAKMVYERLCVRKTNKRQQGGGEQGLRRMLILNFNNHSDTRSLFKCLIPLCMFFFLFTLKYYRSLI